MTKKRLETLCWGCQRVGTSTCQWDKSKGTIPVPGWAAIETTVMMGGYGYKVPVRSYIVIDCPLYVKDQTVELRKPRMGHCGSIHNAIFLRLVRMGYSNEEIAEMYEIKVKTVELQRKKLRKSVEL